MDNPDMIDGYWITMIKFSIINRKKMAVAFEINCELFEEPRILPTARYIE